MSFEIERVHCGIADLLAERVVAWLEHSLHGQAAGGRRATDEREQRVPCAERHPGPVAADLTEQAMLDRVPLRTPRRVVADGHRQAEAIADADLQALLPGAGLIAVAAASVGQQQQVPSGRKRSLPVGLPPR